MVIVIHTIHAFTFLGISLVGLSPPTYRARDSCSISGGFVTLSYIFHNFYVSETLIPFMLYNLTKEFVNIYA